MRIFGDNNWIRVFDGGIIRRGSGFQAYQKAVHSNRGDLRVALAESSKQLAPQSGPRVIQHTTRSNKVIDTEKTLEKKELKADGLIVTEKKRTVEHEEVSRKKWLMYLLFCLHFSFFFIARFTLSSQQFTTKWPQKVLCGCKTQKVFGKECPHRILWLTKFESGFFESGYKILRSVAGSHIPVAKSAKTYQKCVATKLFVAEAIQCFVLLSVAIWT